MPKPPKNIFLTKRNKPTKKGSVLIGHQKVIKKLSDGGWSKK